MKPTLCALGLLLGLAAAARADSGVGISAPASIAAGQTWTSPLISTISGRALFACATLSQTGTLTIRRYADKDAAVQIGSDAVTGLTAGTGACVAVNDGMPYIAAKILMTNSSGSTATVSGVAVGQGQGL